MLIQRGDDRLPHAPKCLIRVPCGDDVDRGFTIDFIVLLNFPGSPHSAVACTFIMNIMF